MAVTLLYSGLPTTIDSLTLDASLSENHQTDVEVTDHPVEQGADVTDHRRRKPDSLTLEGIVSNYPLPSATDVEALQEWQGRQWYSRSSASFGRAESAYQQLLDLADSSVLITVVTNLRIYENMTLTSLHVPRDAKSGQMIRFTATFREIRIVANKTIQVKAATSRATKKKDLNKKNAPAASAPVKRQSVYHYAGQFTSNQSLKTPFAGVVDFFTQH
jgi:hypothetical protein